jgi:hypothetical protein
MVAASLVILLTVSSYSRADALVGRLGGPGYAAREQVGRELVKLGRYALPALRRGHTHADLEIAERCKRLLPLAEAEAVRQRVAHILAVPPLPPPEDLPRLKRFLSITGDTREARELYVEMFQAHVRVLEDVEWAGDRAGEVFWKAVEEIFKPPEDAAFTKQIVDGGGLSRLEPEVTRALVTLFLLLSADPTLKPYECRCVNWREFPILKSSAAWVAIAGPGPSPAMQKLFSAWLVGPRNFESAGAEASRVKEAFRLMTMAHRKFGRPVALQIAMDSKQWHVSRAGALIVLMELGETEDVKTLSGLVTDRTSIGGRLDGGSCQLGDVALAACAKLSGQSMSEYGLSFRPGPFNADRAEALDYGFADEARRIKGREKWAEWASRKFAAGGKP